ncbi:Uncharacterized protein APZ42_014519, partial [Daphnia magna]
LDQVITWRWSGNMGLNFSSVGLGGETGIGRTNNFISTLIFRILVW